MSSCSSYTSNIFYNDRYESLTPNLKAYVDSFRLKHEQLQTKSNLVKEYEEYPLPNIPDLIKCAKLIEYNMMYKVHIELLSNCLDIAPGLFKGIMDGY